MRLKLDSTMATAAEQLVIDSQSRFLDMESLQPYSTTDEYLYAMKEDLADWLANMYPDWRPITAENFLPCLENGALLCHHANNVNEAARKVSAMSKLTNCKYRSDARPETFNARDNVSQFIKWARGVARVREVLMFESDDLICRKNEKNFILCLLEIARFGARFGVSVPAIIKLEFAIEREIQQDKETEAKLSKIELENMQEEQEEEEINQSTDEYQVDQLANQYPINANSNDSNGLEQQVTQFSELDDTNDSKQWQDNDDTYDGVVPSGIPTTLTTTKIVITNEESPVDRTFEEEKPKRKPTVLSGSSSNLHKTVVKMTNSCCCSQRFPVIRIGEGKYRIGENGTVIFIRILRNHVMVRVGGGWDTLENYLNTHDPCRRSGGHHRNDHHHHHHRHADVPILAIPNTNISPSVQKNTPYGKSITIKTEEFPLPKPSVHDTNLADAQLVITRGADGRHRIGQITYKSEEDRTNQPPACPHHHHHHHRDPSPSPPKLKTVRSSGNLTSSSVFNKQSSPSTDQDYSSLTEPTSPSKPSPASSLDFKEESLVEPIKSINLTVTNTRPIRRYSPINRSRTEPLKPPIIKDNNPNIIESIIGNIDGYLHPPAVDVIEDFDINDIADVMSMKKKSTIDMDNDSLDSSEGVLEEKKKPPSTRKSSGYVSAFYLAQKQKFQDQQAVNRKQALTNLNRYSSRSTTISNIVDANRKEGKLRRKPMSANQRSQSSDLLDKSSELSKLDRDSGFDEQDFRRERMNSNGDDNSSISSIKSTRSSTARSMNSENRETKSSDPRTKKLDPKRSSTDKLAPSQSRRNPVSSSPRSSGQIPPIPPANNKHRKGSQPPVQLQLQPETESLIL